MKSLENGPLFGGTNSSIFGEGESNSNHLFNGFNGFNASFISCEPEVLSSRVAVVSAAPWVFLDRTYPYVIWIAST